MLSCHVAKRALLGRSYGLDMKVVVISGVSSGIGNGAARALCQRGYKVFGTVRNASQGERLRHELGNGFTPLCLDVTDPGSINEATVRVSDEVGNRGLSGLVNNAGISVPGPLASLPPEILRQHFEVNVMGVLYMVQAFLPLLRRAGTTPPGRIVNISSVSGRIAYPFMGAYAASKHALEALSDSLRRELLIYGVDVIVIQPGVIDTAIWDKASHIRTSFAHTDYSSALENIDTADIRRNALPVSAVTRRIVDALTLDRPKARYVVSDRWVRHWLLPRLLPDRWVDRAIDRILNFQRIRDALERT